MAAKRVRFRKTSFKALVKSADPTPSRDVEYQFSNGRTFRSKRSS